MLLALLLPFALGLQEPPATPPPAPAPAPVASSPAKSLGFLSQRFPYKWDALLPIGIEVDGVKVKTIFFNRREVKSWPFKGADFGARAQVEVTNGSSKPRVPGFAVAVFDGENRLLGVASGGTKVGTISAGATETFDLNFRQVTERLPLGEYFILSVELAE